MIKIRKVRQSDIYAMADSLNKKEVRKYLFMDDDKKISYKEQEEWIANERFENGMFLVAIVDGKVAGAISLEFDNRKIASKKAQFGMWVDSAFWGKSVSAALIRRAEKELTKRGILRLEANGQVLSTNKRGLAFYKKMGFKIEGIAKNSLLFDSKMVDGIYIGKEVII